MPPSGTESPARTRRPGVWVGLRRSKRLRALLCFFLVPLVVFANPTAARAATAGTLIFEMDAGGFASGTCRIPWGTTETGLVVGVTSRCDSMPDTTVGYCQDFEGECGDYGFVLKDHNGNPCGGTALENYSDESNDITGVSARLGTGFVPLDLANCMPAEACLSYYFDPGFGSTTDAVTCVPIALDGPEEPAGGACDYATVEVPKTRNKWYPANDDGSQERKHAEADFVIHPTSIDQGTGVWVRYIVWRPSKEGDFGPNFKAFGTGETLDRQSAWDYGLVPGVSESWPFTYSMTGSGVPTSRKDLWEDAVIIGAGLYRWPQTGGADDGMRLGPDGGLNQRFGLTIPSLCSFYWGEKVNNDHPDYAGSGTPAGPTSPDVPQEPTEPPDVTDPDDGGFEWGWLVWILNLIKNAIVAIGNAIAALGQAIADLAGAILDGLEALFIPERTIQSRVNSVKGEFDGVFPFNFGEQLEALGAPGGVGTPVGRAPAVPAGAGCPDWKVIVGYDTSAQNVRHDYNAVCDSTFTAAIRTARPFILAGMLAVAFWPLVRGVFYASMPIIKPVPSGGK